MLGFYRLAAAVPRLFLADVKSNTQEIIKLYKEASSQGAAAVLFPEMKVLLFFFIPVKIKWLGLLDGALLLFSFVMGSWLVRAAILAAMASFLLFFGPRLWYNVKRWYTEYKYRKNNNNYYGR